MATTRKWTQQTTTTSVMTTELDLLAAGATAKSAANFTNAQGTANLDGYTRTFVWLHLAAPSGNFAANSAIQFWWLKKVGTTEEDGSSTITPATDPDFFISIRPVGTAQDIIVDVVFPPGVLDILALNSQGSGTQALAATGNTVTLQPYTDQGV